MAGRDLFGHGLDVTPDIRQAVVSPSVLDGLGCGVARAFQMEPIFLPIAGRIAPRVVAMGTHRNHSCLRHGTAPLGKHRAEMAAASGPVSDDRHQPNTFVHHTLRLFRLYNNGMAW